MIGERDLWGEIHEDEIVKIARKAADERGYAIYRDYNDYIEKRMRRLDPEPGNIGRTHEKIILKIKGILEARGWGLSLTGERQFYPPGTDLDQTNQLKL